MGIQYIVPENAIAQIQDGDTTHYICQTGTKLTERDDDGELSPPELLGPAKPGTPGIYVLLGEKRTFYCLSEWNILQDYLFDDEMGEWTFGQLAAVGLEAAPDAEIAATVAGNGDIYVFFQNSSGVIQYILYSNADEQWHHVNDSLATQPSAHLSLFSTAMGSAIYLFYTSKDNSIHELPFDGGKWTDRKVALTESVSRKSRITVTPLENGQYTLQFTNDKEEVWTVHDGELTLQGRYRDGIFQKDNGAEGWNSRGPRVVRR